MRVPVDETEEADDPSSSRPSSKLVSNMGTSGGSLANLDLAKDLWSSLMNAKWGGSDVLSIKIKGAANNAV